MLDLAKNLTKLPPNKRHLLELLLREQGVDLARLPISAHRSATDSLPLSFAQQRLWFLDRLEPGMPFYNMPLMVRLIGELRVDLLERTFSELIRRHEVFRTSFPTVDDQPVQVISPPQPVTIELEDLTTYSGEERESELRRRASHEAVAPFDLDHGPMFRLRLLRVDMQEHVLLLTLHHIISDGWSMGVMIKELAALYSSFALEKPSPLPELGIQYADFAVWQRQWLSGAVLEEQLEYWQRQLSGELPALALATDKTPAGPQHHQGAVQVVTLDGELSEQLRELSVREGLTMFMVLLAGWQLLLSRYSGQEDICVGTPIANRNRAETEGLIGFFVNTLVLRTDLSGDPNVRELLGRVREVCLGAYGHQDMPFEKLVEALAPERDLRRTPLFQTMFILQNASTAALELPGLQLQSLGSGGATVEFDLTLSLSESVHGVQGELSYRTELFEAGTMARLASHYELVLRSLAANPEQRLSELSLLTEAERQQLLVEWNETAAAYPTGQTIAELFEAQVERTPQATALVWDEQELSYQQLNESANQLAHYLAAQGVAAESIVALLLPRGPALLVSVLAVLKAGGAFLPLDVNYPEERLRYVLADAQAGWLLTDKELAARVRAPGAAVICVDENAPWSDASTSNLSRVDHAEQVAYVIYTSGSTGYPKGVLISRGSLYTYTLATIAAYAFGPNDRVLQFASIGFDATVEEIFPTLCSGATLCVRPEEMLGPAIDFLEHCARLRLSLLDLPTAFWHELAAGMQREQLELPDCVRCVIIGGERALTKRVLQWREAVGTSVRLFNTYGPTEATVVATFHEVNLERIEPSLPVPIGRPLANTQAFVLDDNGYPAPIGVPGELYLGGAGLARGYLRRPELTAERFIPHPYSKEPGVRLYRTGDRARYLGDGNLQYLGRLGEQVKLRGYRIELGEIEAVLRRYPGIRECAVLAVERTAGELQLTAYVVSEAAAAAASSVEWRRYLQQQLPGYMVPAQYVALAELPLTANGKLDRRALARLEPEWREAAGASEAARSPVEEMLQSAWQELLGRDQVGIHENFFALGGHSLLATRLISRVRVLFQIELPLRALFDAPTVAGLAAQVEQALGAEEVLRTPGITVVSRAQPLPLSYAQERLWFLDQLLPGSPLYNIPQAVRVSGELSVAALRASLTEIVRRHETLRTRFPVDEAGDVRQEIEAAAAVRLEVEELQDWEEEERKKEVWRRVRAEASEPFDLSRGPLLRARVLRLSVREHVVMLTLHHIISDGWSMGVMIGELAALYSSFVLGEPSPLPELGIQYADFAVWQRQWLSGAVLEGQLEYWRRQLSGELPALALATDKRPGAEAQPQGAGQELWLGGELSEQLRELSVSEGVTLFMVLLAGWQLLLSRYSGQEDICVGTPIANRNRAETEGLIGFFVNTLVLRTDLSGDPNVRELLGRVREVCLGAYGHQDMPFEKLVEALAPERDLRRTPLFQTMFNLQQASTAALELPGLQLQSLESGGEAVKFDLTLSLSESVHGVQGALSYRTELFEAGTMARLASHYELVLRSLAANPEQRLSELSLLTEAERQQLLVEWNETAAAYPTGQTIAEMFEAQVERAPQATALLWDEQELSYAELNQRANQLAHYLVAQGVGAESIVALLLPRGPGLVMSVLAVLKAGGAYLPLDMNYPVERLRYVLADAQAGWLLTDKELSGRVTGSEVAVICVEEDESWRDESTANLSRMVHAEQLAYVIYTSGSSGQPKGVMVRQGAVVNLSWALEEQIYAGQGAGLRVALNAPLIFDASVKQLLQLLRGHTLCLLSEEVRSDAGALLEYLEKQRVEVLDCTPSHLQVLLEEGLEARLGQSLKLVLAGGEKLAGETWEALRQSDGIEYYNVYGPTECTVDATARRVKDEPARASIGRPLGNMEIYILDQRQQLAPMGAPGELYIGGAGLARGYLGRPELTAERFIPHPYSEEPGARLYRTGDRARYLGDGNLEYLGRLDEQVKLRGYRIELGEIEVVLASHPGLREAVVVVKEDKSGDKRLVAYVSGAGEEATGKVLRDYLRERLPEYMVPSAFVMVERLPLTANGKVDRRALPAPDAMSLVLETGFVAPRTPVEEIVAAIWAEVLGRETVSVHDNFFELGGHSLMATRVISRVRDAFGQEVALRSLFEQPTVAGLAQSIELAQRAGGGLSAPAIVPISREAELPLSFAQQRLWFLDQMEPGSAFYNLPTAVRLRGVLKVEALERTLTEVVRRHEVLRTRFMAVDGEAVQVIEPAQEVRLAVTDVSAMAEAERTAATQRLVAEESGRPFDLMRGPLLRMSLLRLGAEEHVALVTMHHIVSDGWSMGVLVREVAALYGAYVRGEESPLEELPIQYADFAHWQRRWLQGEVLSGQLDYWRGELADAPTVIDLPIDKPRPPVQTFRGAHHPLQLSAELSGQLRELSRGHGCTLFMTLLAAFDVLLCRYAGQEQVLVGTPIANRNRSETEALIGFFVNTLVLRGDVRSNPSFGELQRRVRETALGAYAHQDLPFEKLVEELQPERDLSRSPLFQVMFVLQNAPGEGLELEGLSLSGVESAGGETAKYELLLGMEERGGMVVGGLTYNRDLYEAETVRRLVGSYERVLRAVVADPERQVLEIELLSAEEQRQIIEEWNETAREYCRAGGMHRLFEAQVERTPAATAVVFGNERLSYGELNERANRLAHYLRELGVAAEDRVSILLERTPALVVALLGVLKAGGCYVPLDPQYPQERLEFMQADAGVRVLLTTGALAEGCEVGQSEQLRLVYVEEVEQAASSANLGVAVSEQQLAYLIYTSGSTGVPKGVAITHGSAETFIHWASESFEQPALRGVLFSTSICFDLSIFEVFVTLSNGGKVILAENALQLPELAAASEVTLINTVPSAMAELVRLGAVPESVRVVNLAGEALSKELVAASYASSAVQTVYNLYGPSEDTTYSTFTATRKGEPVSIGRPIANTRAYVLDGNRQCVPIGVVGELYLGGAGLARGYFARPELTAEKFVPDSFSQTGGGRLYRTGDLARYLDNGELEFLGRADHQVKVRGYRIELGEIEAVLRRYPGISECAVLAVERTAGEPQLTAYVVSEAAAAAASSVEWQRYLQQHLPEYMVPVQYVRLAELPLTANGKLDRRALARLDPLGEAHSERRYVAARDLMEQKLVQVWEDVLKVKPIGVTDDFFQLGGHSLLAVNLMARIRSSLGQKLPLSDLFQGRTIESLAQLLRAGDLPTDLHPALVGIQPNGSEQPLFCVHAVGGTIFSYAGLAHHLGSQRPFYGLQAKGLDGKHQPYASVEEMATYYIEAVSSVQPDGPYLLAGWSMGGIIALEMARQLREHGEDVARLLLIDTAPDLGNKSQTVIPDHVLLTSFLNHAGIRTDTPVLTTESLRQLTPDEQLAHVLELGRANAVLPPDTKLADIRHLFQVYKANLSADRGYVTPPIPCPVTLFKASEQPEGRRNEVIDQWRALASAGIEVQLIPGSHFSMLREPNVEFLAACVKKSLAAEPVTRFVLT